MDRFGLAIVVMLLLAACSSGGKKSAPAPSSTLAPTTTTAAPTTTTTSAPTGTATTVPTRPTTPPTTTSNNTDITISGFKATPNPIECNAPTMSEFEWKVTGATKVTLSIDGAAPISTFESGTQDLLLPVTCDGKAHTYTLVATKGGAKSESSISVSTKKTS